MRDIQDQGATNRIRLFDLGKNEDIAILSNFKLGSTAIGGWSETNQYLLPYYYDKRIIYAVWRPAYARLVSGLQTGLSLAAKDSMQQSGIYDRDSFLEKFKLLYRDWAAAHTDKSTAHIESHTQSLQDLLAGLGTVDSILVQRIRWINLNQLSLLPAYLNKTHGLSLDALERKNYADRRRSQPWISKQVLFDLLANDPESTTRIQAKADADFVPESIIDIS